MGIRFLCPSGHKLNVKSFLAGKRAICPQCGAKVVVPDSSEPQGKDLSPQAGGIVTNPLAGVAGLGSPSPQDSASLSVIIAVAPSEVAGAPAVTSGPVVTPAVGSLPESVLNAPRPLMDVAEQELTSTEVQRELRRDKTRQTQMAIAVVLFLVVIVLAGVLIWVLQRNAGAPAEEETKPVSVYEPATLHFVVAVSEEWMNGSPLI
jgi:hypothetical protein